MRTPAGGLWSEAERQTEGLGRSPERHSVKPNLAEPTQRNLFWRARFHPRRGIAEGDPPHASVTGGKGGALPSTKPRVFFTRRAKQR